MTDDTPLTASDLAALLDRDVRLDEANLALRTEIPYAVKRLLYDWITDRIALDTAERRIREAASKEALTPIVKPIDDAYCACVCGQALRKHRESGSRGAYAMPAWGCSNCGGSGLV